MNDTLVLPHRSRIDRTDQFVALVGLAAFVLILLVFLPTLSTPTTIPQVTVDNPGTWSVDVSVAPTTDGPWLPLGIAGAGDKTQVADVIDPGDTWIVRFSSGDVSSTERLSRAAIRAGHWTIQVPSEVDGLIKASGADEPPSA